MIDRMSSQQEPQAHLQRIIRRRDLPQYLALRRTKIDELLKSGELKSIKLSKRAVGVFEDDLIAYQQRLKKQSD